MKEKTDIIIEKELSPTEDVSENKLEEYKELQSFISINKKEHPCKKLE